MRAGNVRAGSRGSVTKKRLRVAIIAPPWLKIPSKGYGGVEAVIDNLVAGLVKLGVDVEVFGVGRARLHGAKVHDVTRDEQFEYILKPMYDFALPIPSAHVAKSLQMIEDDGTFDIIHDHNYFVGPLSLRYATQLKAIPPAVHTVHGPPLSDKKSLEAGMSDNRHFWKAMGGNHHCYFVSISDAMKRSMPQQIGENVLPTVHNAIDVRHFPFVDKPQRKRYMITLARFAEEKGQHIAVKLCDKLGYRLRMAGTVSTIASNRRVMLELANPLSKYRNDRDFRYFSDNILPYTLRNPKITYTGSLSGHKKLRFIGEARALLFPVTWNEPFGMAVIEALACGTPVVAMKRGAMPEIIQHGVNGFLADTEEEFEEYMQRVDEIDPHDCRRSVEERFSSLAMAEAYIERYEQAIQLRKQRFST